MNRLSQTLVRGNNNFDLIRLIAALMVMLGHSYGIQAAKKEPVLWFTHLESFGSLAVYAFFMISGMLVSASFANQSSTFRFIGLRVLRIWPGAMICAAFIVLVVGPVFSGLPLSAFLSDLQTWRWLFHNALLIDPVGGPLPQLFEANHLRSLVNATVWTLPVELKCYVIVLVAGLLGCIGSRRRTLAVVVLAVSHWLFPEPARGRAQPAAPAVPDAEAGRIALRAALVVMPAFLLALTDPASYMPIIMKSVSLGRQSCTTSARGAARELLGSTLFGGLLAIVFWFALRLSAHLWMFFLWMLLRQRSRLSL